MQLKPWRVICRNRDGYEEGEPEDFTHETEARRRMARLKEQNPELTVDLLRARPADDAATTGIFSDGWDPVE